VNWRRLPRLVADLPRALAEQRREVRGIAQEIPKMDARLEALQHDGTVARVYVGSDRALLRTQWGGKLLVDTTDLLMSPTLLLDGLWEPDVTEWFKSILRPGMTFVDVGANIGYFSILAASLVGGTGRVIAFEAMPSTYELLARNVLVNWIAPFTTAESLAVYSSSGRLTFYAHKHLHGNSGLADVIHDGPLHDTDRIEVEATSLDEYLCKHPARPDVIKIDVEGAELQVFIGARATLAANPGVVVMCEWSRDQIRAANDDPAALVEEFRRQDFQAYRIDTGIEPIGYDQLLETPYCNVALKRT
jgi:FkbM family methyltransferase